MDFNKISVEKLAEFLGGRMVAGSELAFSEEVVTVLLDTCNGIDGTTLLVLLAHCALFTEISPSADDRATLLKYSQVASILGSSAVFVADYVSDSQKNFVSFQVLCVIIAILSCFAMCYTGMNVGVSKKYQPSFDDGEKSKQETTQDSWWVLTLQIITQRNFICFVIMNFLQIFHTTYSSNFFLIFAEELMGDHLPPFVRSMLAGSTFMLPQLCLAVMLYVSGPNYIMFLALFFVLDKSIPSATFSQFNMPLSDIIDDDLVNSPVSSLVFGTNALFTKPAQSFAPMLIVAILSGYGYKGRNTVVHGKETTESLESSEDLKNVMFNIMCFLPAIIAALQILIWKCYTLRGRKGGRADDPKPDGGERKLEFNDINTAEVTVTSKRITLNEEREGKQQA